VRVMTDKMFENYWLQRPSSKGLHGYVEDIWVRVRHRLMVRGIFQWRLLVTAEGAVFKMFPLWLGGVSLKFSGWWNLISISMMELSRFINCNSGIFVWWIGCFSVISMIFFNGPLSEWIEDVAPSALFLEISRIYSSLNFPPTLSLSPCTSAPYRNCCHLEAVQLEPGKPLDVFIISTSFVLDSLCADFCVLTQSPFLLYLVAADLNPTKSAAHVLHNGHPFGRW
jgi:hypothetical protein